MGISGKVALVTGAAQGIGKAIALRLAKDGADIALVDLHQDKLDTAAAEVRALGRRAVTFIADVSQLDQVSAAVAFAEQELGRFDIIVNNAGIAQVQPLLDVTPEEVDRIMRINVQGTLWGIQAPPRRSRNASRTARSSMPVPSPGMTASPCWACIRPPSLPCAR